MLSRFKTAAGFLATATLLSGSAFAFAPEFDRDLPAIIITDETSNAGQTDPANIFQFTDAFALLDYVNDQDAGVVDPSTYNFLFQEFQDEADTTPESVTTLTINGVAAFTGAVTGGDITNDLTQGGTNPTGLLDFVNVDFASTAASTGTSGDTLPQSRVVDIYLKSDDAAVSAEPFDLASMLVVTTTDGADRFSEAVSSDPFTCFYNPANFGGWTTFGFGSLSGIATSLTGTGTYDTTPTFGPGGLNPSSFVSSFGYGTAAATVTSFTLTANVGAQGFIQAAAPAGSVAVTDGDVYRVRWNASSTTSVSAANRANFIRFDLGGAHNTGHTAYLAPDGATGTDFGVAGAAADYFTYFVAKGTDTLSPTVFIAVQDATRTDNITLNEIEVCSADRADLTGATVLKNIGGTVTAAAGEIAAAASPVAFNTTVAGSDHWNFFAINPVRGTTSALSGSALSFTIPGNATDASAGTNPNLFVPEFVQLAHDNDGTNPAVAGLFNASASKLYIIDVWVNSPQAATATRYPYLSARATVNGLYAADGTFYISPSDAQTGLSGTASKAYSVAFSPQIGALATGKADLALRFLAINDQILSTVTVNVARVTVTEYDKP